MRPTLEDGAEGRAVDLIVGSRSAIDEPTSRIAEVSKAHYYCASSVDGYIAEADDTIEWLLKYEGRLGGTRSSRSGCLRALPKSRPKVEMLSCCAT